MRIGIDGHHLNGKPQGSRTYLLGLIQALARLAPAATDDRLFIYSFEPEATRRLFDAPSLSHHRVFPKSARLRLPFVVPALEMRDRLSVFHSQYICPPLSMVPEVVTIHDILFETHPDLFVDAFSRRSVGLIRRSAQRACRVLTVSDFSRRALLERYRLPEDKVVTIPDAVDHARFHPMAGSADQDRIARVKERYALERPYVLSVGRLEPRKNLVRLIRAFRQARQKLDPGLELILVGQRDFRFEAIEEEIRKSPDGVRFLGPVPDEDLPALYNLAHVFAFPSLVEGFGMPVLESMACGTPVVASRRGALPEVGGDAVAWVEPEDEEAMGAAMTDLLTDTERAARLHHAGLERAKAFSWENAARQTLAVYHECA
jgi:glycosyltransferase involved in cell wall biosynthesis